MADRQAESMHRVFEEVAEATSLREGAEGVEQFFWTVSQQLGGTSREAARKLGLPIPVVAAIRRELEHRGYLAREKGIVLSPSGRAAADALWGSTSAGVGVCPHCRGSGLALAEPDETRLDGIRALAAGRPSADVALDQTHLTPESVLKKVSFFLSDGLLLGNRVLFIGDDDFLSLGAAFLVGGLHGASALARLRISVLEIDPRIVEAIRRLAGERGWPVEAVVGDARRSLPEDIRGCQDVVIADPPYTMEGLGAFLDRAVEALGAGSRGRLAFSFGPKPPGEREGVFRAFLDRGLVPRRWLPGFNEYAGGAILGNRSDLYVLQRRSPEDETGVKGAFYTREAHPGARVYTCSGCGASFPIGPGEEYDRIDGLKGAGCPVCGGTTFVYAGKRP